MLRLDEVLQRIKDDMIKTLEDTMPEHLSKNKDLFDSYFEVLKSVEQLIETKKKNMSNWSNHLDEGGEKRSISTDAEILITNKPDKLGDVKQEDTINSSESSLFENIDNQIETIEKPMYLFERKILGGYLPKIDAIVPEGIVRRLGLEHHDYVYATEVASFHHFKKYHYELAKKADIVIPIDRVEYKYCPIESDGSLLVVRKSLETDLDIRIDGVPQSIRIPDFEISRIKPPLSEGDIIDIAFPDEKPELCRITYIHRVEHLEIDQKSNKFQKKKDIQFTKDLKSVELNLEGKHVLIVGNDPNKVHYKEKIESRGGIFLSVDDKDSIASIESCVKKADVVILLLARLGHILMKQVKKLCKEWNVPFETTFNIGADKITQIVSEALISK
ncbi:DUF2325 domain-containing protein [Brevibacillus sp. 7WMA2]|uniref:DUF2325 domain-containing protein n=1 Tax=Brevibacillus sp. 7WMA2 TaxID=2683193 RepID=UPI0013A74B13|nr:DUF2325 domain-containing protein [Brevibacillus sp. 7WMA2]QIC04888.1 DUF2325 domain-containing protein [Brevibacillus sp. 7WMA2]